MLLYEDFSKKDLTITLRNSIYFVSLGGSQCI